MGDRRQPQAPGASSPRPRPLLGELAYTTYCAMLDERPHWETLSPRERLAWGQAVLVATQVASDVSAVLQPRTACARITVAPSVKQQAYELYVLDRWPAQAVCAKLGIARRTLYRYIAAASP